MGVLRAFEAPCERPVAPTLADSHGTQGEPRDSQVSQTATGVTQVVGVGHLRAA